MKKITKQELIELVNGIKGTTFISADIVTEPKMRKTDNPYLGATKVTTLSGAINFDYESSVNNQLERENKETDFRAAPRSWGQHVDNWVEHKGKYYLPIKVQGHSDAIFIHEGNKIDKDVLKPFLYESHKPHTQEELDKEITVRDVKIESIRAIRIKGDEYLVV